MVQTISNIEQTPFVTPLKPLWDTYYVQFLKKVKVCFILSVCAALLTLGATCCSIVMCSPWFIFALSVFALSSLVLTSLLLTLVLKHKLHGNTLAEEISKDLRRIEINKKKHLERLVFELTYTQVPYLHLLYSKTIKEQDAQIKQFEQQIQELTCTLNRNILNK